MMQQKLTFRDLIQHIQLEKKALIEKRGTASDKDKGALQALHDLEKWLEARIPQT